METSLSSGLTSLAWCRAPFGPLHRSERHPEIPCPESCEPGNSGVMSSRWKEPTPSPRLVGITNLAASALLWGSRGGMVLRLIYKKQCAHQLKGHSLYPAAPSKSTLVLRPSVCGELQQGPRMAESSEKPVWGNLDSRAVVLISETVVVF